MSANAAFLDAIRKKAAGIMPADKPAAEKPAEVVPVTGPVPLGTSQTPFWPRVDVQAVVNEARIDLFFAGKPSEKALEKLHAAKFRYRPSDKAWYHSWRKPEIVDFVNREFSIGLEYHTTPAAVIPELPPVAPAAPVVRQIEPMGLDDSPAWKLYRRQVDQLVGHYKIHPADLMLLAIDCLYKETFGTN